MNKTRWKVGCLLGGGSLFLIIPMIFVSFYVGAFIEYCFGISFDATSFVFTVVAVTCIMVYIASCVTLLPSLHYLSTMTGNEFMLTVLALFLPFPVMAFFGYMTVMNIIENGNPFVFREGFGL